MTDLVLTIVFAASAVLIGVATYIGYRVMRLAEHPPLGWILLVVSFFFAFVRTVLFLEAYAGPSSGEAAFVYAGQVISAPIVAFVFAGVYFLYTDFKRQLARQQAEIIAPVTATVDQADSSAR